MVAPPRSIVCVDTGAFACTREGGPTSLILPSSMSTAAGESTLLECGSSRCAALMRTNDAAKSVLILAIMALYGIEQLFRVIPDAILEDDLDVLDIGNVRGEITFHDDEVRVLTDCDRADLIFAPEVGCTV